MRKVRFKQRYVYDDNRPYRRKITDDYKYFTFLIGEFWGRKCWGCGSTYRVQGHHVIFRSHGRCDCLGNVIPLCIVCHAKAHDQTVIVEGGLYEQWLSYRYQR